MIRNKLLHLHTHDSAITVYSNYWNYISYRKADFQCNLYDRIRIFVSKISLLSNRYNFVPRKIWQKDKFDLFKIGFQYFLVTLIYF